MIDRICFQIMSVNINDLKTKLDFNSKTLNVRTGEFDYSCKLNNLNIMLYSSSTLRITGSLHKFAKGNNYSLFTYEDAKNVINELSSCLDIPLENFIVTKIELGLNIKVRLDQIKYIKAMKSYKRYIFIPMTPYSRTSKIRGCRCKLSEYEIKLYDKSFEFIKSEKNKVKDSIYLPKNILRFEMTFSRKYLRYLGFKNMTGKSLQSPLHYRKFIKILSSTLNEIQFNSFTVNYCEFSKKQIESYLIVQSDKYDDYLNYIKEFKGTDVYYNENRKRKKILKEFSYHNCDLIEKEFREEFVKALSKV